MADGTSTLSPLHFEDLEPHRFVRACEYRFGSKAEVFFRPEPDMHRHRSWSRVRVETQRCASALRQVNCMSDVIGNKKAGVIGDAHPSTLARSVYDMLVLYSVL
jgi:hypothetical protein